MQDETYATNNNEMNNNETYKTFTEETLRILQKRTLYDFDNSSHDNILKGLLMIIVQQQERIDRLEKHVLNGDMTKYAGKI